MCQWQTPPLLASPPPLPLLLLLLLLLLLQPLSAPPFAEAVGRPSSTSARVGIVGAGPAGLHMAYLLQQLGFSNVQLLEAAPHAGGRSVSLPGAGGVVHEMAACYVNSEYGDLRRLAEWAGWPLQLATLPEAKLLLRGGSQLDLKVFIARQVLRLLPGTAPGAVQQLLRRSAARYAQLHAELFGNDDSFEFPTTRPRRPLDCSVAEFLRRHSLLALKPLFLLGMTSMGYGGLADTSATYGLMWMTPKYVGELLEAREQSQLALLRDGFQPLWRRVQRRLGDGAVGVGRRVVGVRRDSRGVVVELAGAGSLLFDWLVWTPDLSATAGLFRDLDDKEAGVFASLRPRYFSTSLVDSPPRAPAVAYFLENLLGRNPDPEAPWAFRHSAKALNLTASDDNRVVVYRLSDEEPASPAKPFAFRFMPHFSVADMAAGALWDILDLQGRRGVWFAGHSVVFDSVKSVIKYNKMLLSLAYPELRQRIREL